MLVKKPKGATERRSNSASGLLWMFVGAVLTVMVGVFLYLSPWFDFSPAAPVPNAQREIQPRLNTDTDNSDYQFYDILPSQEMVAIPDSALDDDNIGPSWHTFDEHSFQPDAVVVDETPHPSNNDVTAEHDDANYGNYANYGISEESILNGHDTSPIEGADVVVIEENTTYDDGDESPSSDTAPQSSVRIQAATPRQTYILQINSFSSASEADRRRAQVLMAGVDARVVKRVTANDDVLYQVVSEPMSNRQAVLAAQHRLQNNGIDSLIVEQRR